MPLDLPVGTKCFIDANVVYYAFVETPPLTTACRQFIGRVQDGDLQGFTSVQVLADVVHKTMLAEASMKFSQNRQNLISWLGRDRDRIRVLTDFVDVAARMEVMNLQCLEMDRLVLAEASQVSQQHGLFTNDAMIVAIMHRHQLTDLVTNDDDFDDLPGLKVWKPR